MKFPAWGGRTLLRSLADQFADRRSEDPGQDLEPINVDRDRCTLQVRIGLLGNAEGVGDMSLSETCGLAQLEEPLTEGISFPVGRATL